MKGEEFWSNNLESDHDKKKVDMESRRAWRQIFFLISPDPSREHETKEYSGQLKTISD